MQHLLRMFSSLSDYCTRQALHEGYCRNRSWHDYLARKNLAVQGFLGCVIRPPLASELQQTPGVRTSLMTKLRFSLAG